MPQTSQSPYLDPCLGLEGSAIQGAEEQEWTWQVLPSEVLYKSYLAGDREPRFASQQFYEHHQGRWLWDVTLGGRAGILRYGTTDLIEPEGFQVDIEGAAFPRLTLDDQRDLVAADFRFGVPMTVRSGVWEYKFGYFHLSSHMGDEWMLRYPGVERINYVREALVLGFAVRPTENWRLYAETDWSFFARGGAEPWEFQFGAEYSSMAATGFHGSPFLAVNGRLRQELNFGGTLVAQTGWQWRSEPGRLFRLGLHYQNGASNQHQFYRVFEQQLGFGIWYDY